MFNLMDFFDALSCCLGLAFGMAAMVLLCIASENIRNGTHRAALIAAAICGLLTVAGISITWAIDPYAKVAKCEK